MVIWLLGLPGAGKTTLGVKLEQYLNEQEKSCCLIDGNIVRDFFNNDLGYSKEERILNMKRIMLSAYFLEKSNVIAIVCNISPFKSMRNFARNKFADYIEIYLSKPYESARMEPGKEKIYNQNETPVIGRDIPFEIPENYDLKLNTETETVNESFEKIINFLKKRRNL